jgi:anti-sigma-K factor RskA
MSAMNHQDARELLALAALGALSAEDRAAIEAHISWCAECRKELAELRDAAASVGASLPPRPMETERNERVRARLLRRAKSESAEVTMSRPLMARVSSVSPARWLIAALLVVGAGLFGFILGTGTRRDEEVAALKRAQTEAQQQIAEQKVLLDALANETVQQKSLLAALTGPGVRVIDAAAVSPRQPYARMFWDQPANRWTFVAYNLPAAKAGRTYQLWLVTKDQQKVSAGTFAATPNGSAIVRATYALAPDKLAAIAVTEEPEGGSKQPTTTPFLVGAAGGK